MLRVTFRTKLLLAMMFVVSAVCVATLLVAQQRVQKNYERMFRQQFERQIGYFTTLQESRLAAIKDQCLKFSQSARLIDRMSGVEPDPAELAKDLYQYAEVELRSVLEDLPGEARQPLPVSARERRAAFFRFLDAAGKVVSPPEGSRSRPDGLLFRRRLEPQLIFVREALAGTAPQQVGYLALPVQTNQFLLPRAGLRRMGKPPPQERKEADETPTLQEVIVTKVIDPTTNRTLGALALGFALPDLVPQRKTLEKAIGGTNQLELIQTGVLLEEKLYADPAVIPDAVGAAVAQLISGQIKLKKNRQADFDCKVGEAHYRVFYELMSDSTAFPPAYQVCLYSMDQALQEQRDLRWKVVALGAAALLVALALSLFISHDLSAPIRDLVASTGEIRKGNFQVRVPVRSRDEVGQLTASFNEMADGLAQKEKYRTVLNMVADEKVAQRLVAGELTLGGELREISVLFCDIRGFTTLTQNMPPGDVIEMLNEHMTALTRVVKEHHGVLDKYVGDLLMAIFGAPIRHGDDALNASRCALRLREARTALNRTSRHPLQVGIGIATGTVVAGCMGSSDRLNYTVLGERVNLASRLCDRAGAGEILIDDNSRQQLGEKIQVEPTGNIELKGFAVPVAAFRLVGVGK